MEKIVLFNGTRETFDIVKNIAGSMKVHTFCQIGKPGTIKELTDGAVKEFAEPDDANCLLMFCDISEKHMDSMLARLRTGTAKIDFKAILTPTNSGWNYKRLIFELQREQAGLK